MDHYQLTMFQNFNAMRIYMTAYFEETKDEDIGLLLSGMKLSSNFPDWRENPQTWDAVAWDDWMNGVKKTLQDMKLSDSDPLWITYNEQMAFLCMKNYLQLFYQEVAFEGVKNILKIINTVNVGSKIDKEWNYWLTCIQAAIDQEKDIIA